MLAKTRSSPVAVSPSEISPLTGNRCRNKLVDTHALTLCLRDDSIVLAQAWATSFVSQTFSLRAEMPIIPRAQQRSITQLYLAVSQVTRLPLRLQSLFRPNNHRPVTIVR